MFIHGNIKRRHDRMINFKTLILSICTAAFIAGISTGIHLYKTKTPKTIQGYIYIRSEKPVNIVYTNGLGFDEVITTDELDAPFELGQLVKVYNYHIGIYSETGPQTFMVKVYFEDAYSENNFEKVIYDKEEYQYTGQYFPPWTDRKNLNINL